MGIKEKYTGFENLVTITTQVTKEQSEMIDQVEAKLKRDYKKTISKARLHRYALELLREKIFNEPDFYRDFS